MIMDKSIAYVTRRGSVYKLYYRAVDFLLQSFSSLHIEDDTVYVIIVGYVYFTDSYHVLLLSASS